MREVMFMQQSVVLVALWGCESIKPSWNNNLNWRGRQAHEAYSRTHDSSPLPVFAILLSPWSLLKSLR